MLSLARKALLGLGLAAAFAQSSAAQVAFPQRPVTMIVGFAAGGPSDVVARLVAAPMGADLGQPVVVENIPGAGGTIGHGRLLQATVPTLYRRLPFDPVGSVKPIGLINEVPMTIVVRRAFPASSLAKFIAAARREGDPPRQHKAGFG